MSTGTTRNLYKTYIQGGTGTEYETSYLYGGNLSANPSIEEIREYLDKGAKPKSFSMRDNLVRKLGSIALGFGIESDSDNPDDIIKALKEGLPDPFNPNSSKRTTINANSKELEQIIKKLAEALNDAFGTDAEPLIYTDQDPDSLMREVSDHIHSLSTGVCDEFFKTYYILDKYLDQLDSLSGVSKTIIDKTVETLEKNTTDERSSNAVSSFKETLNELMAEYKNVAQTIRNAIGVVSTESDLIKYQMLKTNQMGEYGMDDKDMKRNELMARIMNQVGSAAHMSGTVNKALEKMGISLKEYKNFDRLEDLIIASEKKFNSMRVTDNNAREVAEIRASLPKLIEVFPRRSRLKGGAGCGSHNLIEEYNVSGGQYCDTCSPLTPLTPTGGGNEFNNSSVESPTHYIGGSMYESSQTELNIKQAENKRLLTLSLETFARVINRHIDEINTNFMGIVDEIGKDSRLNINLMDTIMTKLQSLELLRNPEIFLGMAEYRMDITYKVRTKQMMTNLDVLVKAINDYKTSNNEIKRGLDNISKSVSSIIKELEDISKIIKTLAKGVDLDDISQAITPLVSNISRVTKARTRITQSIYVAQMRKNVLDNAEETASYSKNYPKLLGEAIGKKRGDVANFEAELIKKLNTATNPITSMEQKVISEHYRSVQVLYKALESLDLTLSYYTKSYVRDPTMVKKLMKFTEDTQMYSKWYTDYTGDQLTQLFDLQPTAPNNDANVGNVYSVEINRPFTASSKLASGTLAQGRGTLLADLKKGTLGKPTSTPPLYENSTSGTHPHYYLAIQAAMKSKNTADEIHNTALPPMRVSYLPKAKKHIDSFYKNFQALKNIFHSFAVLVDHFSANDGRVGGVMSVTQIYYAIIEYLKHSSLRTTGATFKIASIGEKRFEDELCAKAIRAVLGVTLSAVGMIHLENQPIDMGVVTAIRAITGGAVDQDDLDDMRSNRPEVLSPGFELYYYATRLTEFYSRLFNKYKGDQSSDAAGRKIILPKNVTGDFSNLLQIVISKNLSVNSTNNPTYADTEINMIIKELNRVYKKVKNEENPIRAALQKLIHAVNSSYVHANENLYQRKTNIYGDRVSVENLNAAGLSSQDMDLDAVDLNQIAKYIGKDQTGSLKFPNETLMDAQLSNNLDAIGTQSDTFTQSRQSSALPTIMSPTFDIADNDKQTFRDLKKTYKNDISRTSMNKIAGLQLTVYELFDDLLKDNDDDELMTIGETLDAYKKGFNSAMMNTISRRLAGTKDIDDRYVIAKDLINQQETSYFGGGEGLFAFNEMVVAPLSILNQTINLTQETLSSISIYDPTSILAGNGKKPGDFDANPRDVILREMGNVGLNVAGAQPGDLSGFAINENDQTSIDRFVYSVFVHLMEPEYKLVSALGASAVAGQPKKTDLTPTIEKIRGRNLKDEFERSPGGSSTPFNKEKFKLFLIKECIKCFDSTAVLINMLESLVKLETALNKLINITVGSRVIKLEANGLESAINSMVSTIRSNASKLVNKVDNNLYVNVISKRTGELKSLADAELAVFKMFKSYIETEISKKSLIDRVNNVLEAVYGEFVKADTKNAHSLILNAIIPNHVRFTPGITDNIIPIGQDSYWQRSGAGKSGNRVTALKLLGMPDVDCTKEITLKGCDPDEVNKTSIIQSISDNNQNTLLTSLNYGVKQMLELFTENINSKIYSKVLQGLTATGLRNSIEDPRFSYPDILDVYSPEVLYENLIQSFPLDKQSNVRDNLGQYMKYYFLSVPRPDALLSYSNAVLIRHMANKLDEMTKTPSMVYSSLSDSPSRTTLDVYRTKLPMLIDHFTNMNRKSKMLRRMLNSIPKTSMLDGFIGGDGEEIVGGDNDEIVGGDGEKLYPLLRGLQTRTARGMEGGITIGIMPQLREGNVNSVSQVELESYTDGFPRPERRKADEFQDNLFDKTELQALSLQGFYDNIKKSADQAEKSAKALEDALNVAQAEAAKPGMAEFLAALAADKADTDKFKDAMNKILKDIADNLKNMQNQGQGQGQGQGAFNNSAAQQKILLDGMLTMATQVVKTCGFVENRLDLDAWKNHHMTGQVQWPPTSGSSPVGLVISNFFNRLKECIDTITDSAKQVPDANIKSKITDIIEKPEKLKTQLDAIIAQTVALTNSVPLQFDADNTAVKKSVRDFKVRITQLKNYLTTQGATATGGDNVQGGAIVGGAETTIPAVREGLLNPDSDSFDKYDINDKLSAIALGVPDENAAANMKNYFMAVTKGQNFKSVSAPVYAVGSIKAQGFIPDSTYYNGYNKGQQIAVLSNIVRKMEDISQDLVALCTELNNEVMEKQTFMDLMSNFDEYLIKYGSNKGKFAPASVMAVYSAPHQNAKDLHDLKSIPGGPVFKLQTAAVSLIYDIGKQDDNKYYKPISEVYDNYSSEFADTTKDDYLNVARDMRNLTVYNFSLNKGRAKAPSNMIIGGNSQEIVGGFRAPSNPSFPIVVSPSKIIELETYGKIGLSDGKEVNTQVVESVIKNIRNVINKYANNDMKVLLAMAPNKNVPYSTTFSVAQAHNTDNRPKYRLHPHELLSLIYISVKGDLSGRLVNDQNKEFNLTDYDVILGDMADSSKSVPKADDLYNKAYAAAYGVPGATQPALSQTTKPTNADYNGFTNDVNNGAPNDKIYQGGAGLGDAVYVGTKDLTPEQYKTEVVPVVVEKFNEDPGSYIEYDADVGRIRTYIQQIYPVGKDVVNLQRFIEAVLAKMATNTNLVRLTNTNTPPGFRSTNANVSWILGGEPEITGGRLVYSMSNNFNGARVEDLVSNNINRATDYMTANLVTRRPARSQKTMAKVAGLAARIFIEMNLNPINVHSLQRVMPLANIANYALTADRILASELNASMDSVKNGFGNANSNFDKQSYKILQKPPDTSVGDLYMQSIVDPYHPDTILTDGIDEGLGMGVPKFIQDQLSNKVLFRGVYFPTDNIPSQFDVVKTLDGVMPPGNVKGKKREKMTDPNADTANEKLTFIDYENNRIVNTLVDAILFNNSRNVREESMIVRNAAYITHLQRVYRHMLNMWTTRAYRMVNNMPRMTAANITEFRKANMSQEPLDQFDAEPFR